MPLSLIIGLLTLMALFLLACLSSAIVRLSPVLGPIGFVSSGLISIHMISWLATELSLALQSIMTVSRSVLTLLIWFWIV